MKRAWGRLLYDRSVKSLLLFLWSYIVAFVVPRHRLALHVAAKHNQLQALRRRDAKPRIRTGDRLLWGLLAKLTRRWRLSLVFVEPETVLRWERDAVRLLWRAFCRLRARRARGGRPTIPDEHIELIRRISTDNPTWGVPKIQQELRLKLGIDHNGRTIARYRVRPRRDGRPRAGGQRWATFLNNQAKQIWACDFMVQYTLTLQILYVFVIVELDTRRMIHVACTGHPTLDWVKQQMRNACFDEQPKFLIHDNDGIYGQLGAARARGCRSAFDRWLRDAMHIRGIPTPYDAPQANGRCERLIGTLRRELLDHLVVLSERGLRAALGEFRRYYNGARPHQGIKAIPTPYAELRAPPPRDGRVVVHPVLGGLHHDYRRAA